ncbi:MAG: InlB B-repeat-containing protein, partial [Alphaproteobacteria bacterium]
GFIGSSITTIPTGSTGNKTFYAKWTAITYTITYYPNTGTCPGGTCTPTAYDITTTTITLPIPTRSGYTFGGWYDNSGFIGSSIPTIPTGSTGNKTFYAKWTANVYTITLDFNNDGDTDFTPTANCPYPGNTCTCTAGTPCALPGSGLTPPSNTVPYSFDGWDSADDGSGAAGVAGDTDYGTSWDFSSSVTIYARWKKTIDFQDNHTPSTTYATQTCYHNGVLALPTTFPPAESSGFSAGDTSWYQDNAGTLFAYSPSATTTCDDAIYSLVYPKWNYTVSYDGNGGTITSPNVLPEASTCTKNLNCELAAVPPMTRSGHVLDSTNWNTENDGLGDDYASGSTTFNNSSGTPAGDITLYAKWIACSAGQWVNIGTNTCEDCPIGSYCPAGATSPTACPPGHTTSAINSTVITACYITAGTGGTLFCDSNGCFTLPDLGSPANNIIHYQL